MFKTEYENKILLQKEITKKNYINILKILNIPDRLIKNKNNTYNNNNYNNSISNSISNSSGTSNNEILLIYALKTLNDYNNNKNCLLKFISSKADLTEILLLYLNLHFKGDIDLSDSNQIFNLALEFISLFKNYNNLKSVESMVVENKEEVNDNNSNNSDSNVGSDNVILKKKFSFTNLSNYYLSQVLLIILAIEKLSMSKLLSDTNNSDNGNNDNNGDNPCRIRLKPDIDEFKSELLEFINNKNKINSMLQMQMKRKIGIETIKQHDIDINNLKRIIQLIDKDNLSIDNKLFPVNITIFKF